MAAVFLVSVDKSDVKYLVNNAFSVLLVLPDSAEAYS